MQEGNKLSRTADGSLVVASEETEVSESTQGSRTGPSGDDAMDGNCNKQGWCKQGTKRLIGEFEFLCVGRCNGYGDMPVNEAPARPLHLLVVHGPWSMDEHPCSPSPRPRATQLLHGTRWIPQ